MRKGAAPLGEELAILTLGPPAMACAWWVLSRGWAKTVQKGVASQKTRRRQQLECVGLLIAMYVMGFGMALYAWLR